MTNFLWSSRARAAAVATTAAQAHRGGKPRDVPRGAQSAAVPKYMRKDTAPQAAGAASETPLPSASAGDPSQLSAWVDMYNDRVALEIATQAASPEDIPRLVKAALDSGRLITTPTDVRIPAPLRAGPSKS